MPTGQLTGQTPGQPTGQPVVLSGLDGEAMALRELVRVLQDQLAKAEEREREGRRHLQADHERIAAAEHEVGELRRLLNIEMDALRADLATVQAHVEPDKDKTTASGRRPLSGWLRGFTRRARS